jgi:hypothetical protein
MKDEIVSLCKRTDLHQQLCEHFGLNHCDPDVQRVTSNLDKSIGFDVEKAYSDEEIEEFAYKLYEKLKELQSKDE